MAAVAKCKIQRNEMGDPPSFEAKLVTSQSFTNSRYNSLVNRIRYLSVGMLILLLAVSALAVFVIAENVARHPEGTQQSMEKLSNSLSNLNVTINDIDDKVRSLRNKVNEEISVISGKINGVERQVGTVEKTYQPLNERLNQSISGISEVTNLANKNQQSLTQLSELLDSKVGLLNAAMENLNSTISDTLNRTLEKMRNSTESKLINDVNIKLNDTVKSINVNTAISIGQAVNATYNDMMKYINQSMVIESETRSFVNSSINLAVNETLNDVDKRIHTAITDLIMELHYGPVFTFDVNDLMSRLMKSNMSVFTLTNSRLVSGIPIGTVAQLKDPVSPVLTVQIGCVKTMNVTIAYPVRKSITVTVLGEKNTSYYSKKFTAKELPSCESISTHYLTDVGFSGKFSDMKAKGVVVDGKVRVRVNVTN